MTFVFPILLGSLALIGIPVLIHLIMRKKPKIEVFPAFRFLLQRQRINVRRLRLRHLVLLILRVLLLACIGLALARPQVFFQSLSLRGDQPAAVVMIFDTSFTMQYKGNHDVPRLEQAKQQGLEFIRQLPQGSRVAILDTAESATGRPPWYQVMSEARDRIAGLTWKPANAPVSQRLENAYRLLADLANSKDDERVRHLPRLILIFSDRTRSSWNTFGDVGASPIAADGKGTSRLVSKFHRLEQAADQVPPIVGGLHQAREYVPNLIDLLGELRDKLPPEPGKDYPQQELIGSLTQMNEVLPRVTTDDLVPGADLLKTVNQVRRQTREMILAMGDMKDVSDTAKEYREKLLTSLNKLLSDLAGARAFFIDVGIDQPIDLTLLDLALPSVENKPRQVFDENEKFQLRAHVLATGKDASTTLTLKVGSKSYQKNLDFKAGQVQVVAFELDCRDFGVGQHSAEMKLGTDDLLPGNNIRYLTFAVRPPRRVLVLSDDPAKAEELAFALSVNGFIPEVARPQDRAASGLLRYQAVYLDSLTNPAPSLWAGLEEYVNKGGGVAVIPGGPEMNLEAYNQGPAQRLLPGTWRKLVTQEKKPAAWNFSQTSIFQHPLMRPFLDWTNKDRRIDFILHPREATQYWEVQPKEKEMVLVQYDDDRDRPALLERSSGQPDRPGRVLMFTTTLDPRMPPWNNYLEATTAFYPVLVGLSTAYLVNDTQAAQLNFVCGQGARPTVHMPPAPRFSEYLLQGPGIHDNVRVPDEINDFVIPQAVYPGNYSLHSLPPNQGRFTARFSLNLPAEESNLSRIPISDLEIVLGKGSVLAGQESTNLHDIMQGQWSEPVEMFPSLMVAILLMLALENLLANRFYKRET